MIVEKELNTELSTDNPNWVYMLSLLDASSQNQYTRTAERFLEFCKVEGIAKENAESVEKFLIYCKDPQAKPIFSSNVMMPKDTMAAKTLWAVLSHLKKFFNACYNRHICEENVRLNGFLLQWEKSEEINQAKVSSKTSFIIVIFNTHTTKNYYYI
jgi:hypothetical protein